MTHLDLLYLTVAVVYVVDVSGFTQTWLGWISRFLHARVTELRPFSCSTCMTWWSGIVYLIATGSFTLLDIAVVAVLSSLAYPIGQVLIFVREGLLAAVSKLLDKL